MRSFYYQEARAAFSLGQMVHDRRVELGLTQAELRGRYTSASGISLRASGDAATVVHPGPYGIDQLHQYSALLCRQVRYSAHECSMLEALVDLTHPIRAVVPTLDGPVLQALAGTTRRLTAPEILNIAGAGSLNGVRRVLLRLSEQGLVKAQRHTAAVFYEANRDHLAWPAVESLAGIRRRLLDLLQNELNAWEAKPVHASLFGSMARREGDAQSDIDVLLVLPTGIYEDEAPWAEQVDDLRRKVRDWTGNHCQAFQLDVGRLAQHARAADPLVQEWLRDSILLAGSDFKTLLRRLPFGER